MKIALVALAVPLALSAPHQDVIEAKATKGSQIKKTFGESSTWTLADMTQTVAGQDVPQELPEIVGEHRREIVVVDTYKEWGDSRPQQLGLVFDEARVGVGVEISLPDGRESYEYELESPLVAKPITFDWDEDEEAYGVELDEDDDVGELLDGLVEDMDLRALLPDEKVSEGDSWTIEPAAFASILAPGGDLAPGIDGLPEGEYRFIEPLQLLAGATMSPSGLVDEIDGKATAEWQDTTEEDGRRIAEIALSVELELTGEVQDQLLRLLEQAGVEFSGSDLTFEVRWELEGEGMLRWDLAAGHFSTFRLDAESAVEGSMNFTQDMGQPVEIQIDYELEGQTRLEAEAEEVE